MRARLTLLILPIALSALSLGATANAGPTVPSPPDPTVTAARAAAPVVMTGAQIPAWSRVAATGAPAPYPSGVSKNVQGSPFGADGVRSAHNGTLTVPPDPAGRTGVDPGQIAAYQWTGTTFREVPVQIDQRFPNFLANGHSSFSFYSGTDQELTYAFAPDGHATGEEAWKKAFGTCGASYAQTQKEVDAAVAAGVISPETAASLDSTGYFGPMQDPVATLDDDDEVSFMASDAGSRAPVGVGAPAGASNGQVVTVTDPLDPTSARYVYLFLKTGGSSFTSANGYVTTARDANADQWVDQGSWAESDPNKIGTSNGDYGPNLAGTVCANPDPADTTVRTSTDRNPRDGMTITTPTYQLHADGRWLVKNLKVTDPLTHLYGPNIIARWKGRAFQQTPDSSISVVGFEDEQVNWEMNSALLGWRAGPVRSIREVWGADSGTNVTKTETYYRDADVYAYHVRVHPIPADGLYTDWSYRPGVATRYYNTYNAAGAPIDGQPDTSVGEVDQIPVTGQDAEVNSCDPTAQICSALNNPEEVAGKGFGLVYQFELTGPTAAAGNVAVVPYYRDDACFDDGTGDAPAPRPWPGETRTDPRVEAGYLAYWQSYWDTHPEVHGYARPAAYADLACDASKAGPFGDPTTSLTTPPWKSMPFQGAIAEHGVHFFTTQDSDNAFSPTNVDEIDGQQWRFEVPMSTPTNVSMAYGKNVTAKLVGTATPLSAAPGL